MPELISSAEHLVGDDKKLRFDASGQSWQEESWRLFGEVGEYKSAVGWISNGLSQLIASPVVWDQASGQWLPDEDARAWAAVQSLGNQAELFRTWGTNSVTTGEAMLVDIGDIRMSRWVLRSRASILTQSGRFYLDEYGQGRGPNAKTPKAPYIRDAWRIFQPSAKFAALADTPPAAFLADLEQLRLLRLVLNAKLKTRLWMNGIWVFGQKVTLPTAAGKQTAGRQASFLAELKVLVTTNMARRDGASDISPIFMQVGTPEVGDVVKQYYPEVAIDAREAELRKEIRQTLRELLDLPVEMQTSMSDTNHWGSWSITEMAITYSLLPRAKQLLDAISLSWYQEQLIARGMSAAEALKRKLIPDASNLQGEASSDEARQAHDRGAASATFVRGRSRIPEAAKPDDDEYVRIIGRTKGIPYLALWGTPAWKVIDEADAWDKVGVKTGVAGVGTEDPKRAPGVGDPGSTTDPNSEVGDS